MFKLPKKPELTAEKSTLLVEIWSTQAEMNLYNSFDIATMILLKNVSTFIEQFFGGGDFLSMRVLKFFRCNAYLGVDSFKLIQFDVFS